MLRTKRPRQRSKPTPAPTPKRITPSIKLDPINPRDFQNYDHRFSCEDCSHFDSVNIYCTMGYEASKHLRAEQMRTYELCGKIALCRAIEID